MALQVEVGVEGVHDFTVHHCAGGAVAAPIAIVRVAGEEPHMVALSDDDDSNRRIDL